MIIAIQGEAGSFSEEAALQLHPQARTLSCGSFPELFAAFRAGRAERALVPIENTLAGSIGENLDLLQRSPGFIVGEIQLRIQHHLLVHPRAVDGRIQRVLSHAVALQQCRRFLARHPDWEPVPFYDTAGSIKHLMETGELTGAAIAGRRAAATYGARIAQRGIEDNKRNFTRFLLLAPTPAGPGTMNKISVVFNLRNQPGALFAALGALAREGISLSRIESRPVAGKPWEYSFFVDILADPKQAPTRRALRALEKHSTDFRLFGAYAAHLNGGKTRQLPSSTRSGRPFSLSLSDFMRTMESAKRPGTK